MTLDAAASFIWANARLLDRRLFSFHFDAGSADRVVDALLAYRNADGGFGNALEPDLRTPASQPVPAEWALRILDEVDVFDDAIVNRLCDWLASVSTGGVPFVLPTASGYPHAPWWEPGETQPAHVNPTSAIAGILHGRGVDHPWVEPAVAFSWEAIENIGPGEVHSFVCALTFLERLSEDERAEGALERLGETVRAATSFDQSSTDYVHHALDFAPSPEAAGRSLFSDAEIEADLDGLAARQADDGGWPVPWPPPSEAAAVEWRGWLTLRALTTLKAYGRL